MSHLNRRSRTSRTASRPVSVPLGDGKYLAADQQSAPYLAEVWRRSAGASPEQVFGGAHGAAARVMQERQGRGPYPSPRQEAMAWGVRVPS